MKLRVFGYCRVSTMKQSLKRQEETIKELYPEAIFVTDSTTGRNFDRPGWSQMMKTVKPGETIVFDEVSRLSRDAEEGFEIYQELFQKGVNLIFISEPLINTDTYKKAMETEVPLTGTNVDYILEGVNKYLLSLAKEQIRIAFEKSQSEVDHNSRRTSKGLKAKQKHNEELKILYPDTYKNHPEYRQIGQDKGVKLTTKKSIEAKEVILKRSKDFNGELSDQEVMKLTGIARGTYYKYKRELKSR